jgi:hypothetical protein
MPRAYWKGYLRLSLVTCPIELFPATSQAEKTHFHQINTQTGHRLRQQMVDEETVGGERTTRSNCLHPRHRHDLDDFYPCARHLQMGMVASEYFCGRIMRFGLHNRIAADLIFCV